MVTYKNKVNFVNTLRDKNIGLFTPNDLKKLFAINSDNTVRHLLMRLTQDNVVERLIRGKYIFLHSNREISDFEIANFLHIPSYVSLESALSMYGVIEQVPYKVTSMVLGRGREYRARGKMFAYSKIRKADFRDFVRKDDFLIATEEKALYDYLYFVYKGLRPAEKIYDLIQYLRNREVSVYLRASMDRGLSKFIRRYVKL
jgi:predicted transcriptional regulator of viral defense system